MARGQQARQPHFISIADAGIAEDASPFLAADHANSTITEYSRHFRRYAKWRLGFDGGDAMDASPEALAQYIGFLTRQGYALTTISVAVAAIRHHYCQTNALMRDPALIVDRALSVASRTLGKRSPRASTPMTVAMLRAMIPPISSRTTNVLHRNAAIVLIGYYAALRRPEIAGLKVGDIEKLGSTSLRIHVRRSRTTQNEKGIPIDIHRIEEDPDICPLQAFREWMNIRVDADDFDKRRASSLPLFVAISRKDRLCQAKIGPKTIERVLAKLVGGLPKEASGPRFTPHPLRSGLLTEASPNDNVSELMAHARHKKLANAMACFRPEADWNRTGATTVTRRIGGGKR